MELLVMPVGAAALSALLPCVEGCGRGHGAVLPGRHGPGVPVSPQHPQPGSLLAPLHNNLTHRQSETIVELKKPKIK